MLKGGIDLTMDGSKMAFPAPGHLGVVVKDLDKAKESLSRVLGLGPWQVIDYAPTKGELIIGEPFRLRLAVAGRAPLVLELVQPLEGKSIWSEFLERKGEGLHHIAFTIPNWDEMVQVMEQAGGSMAVGGTINGKRWCYFETSPGGLVVEYEERKTEEGQVVSGVPEGIDTVKLPPPENITVVVKDIGKTTEFLSRACGIGPWETMEYAPTKDELMAGEPFKLKFAFAEMGSIVLQLTQPLEGKTLWREFLENKGEGMHNLFFSVPNWEGVVAKFKEQGNQMLAGGILDGKRWCIFDAKPGGITIELGES